MSLIADSLKKAVKEKSSTANLGVNLLKHLGPKPKVNPNEVKRFIFLIVIPAAILIYLLVANPFAPDKRAQPKSPPAVAKAPPVTPPVPQPAPSPAIPTKPPAKEPGNIQVIEPGMTEVSVLEAEVSEPKTEIAVPESASEEVSRKPVPGPKKKSTLTLEPAPDAPFTQEQPATEAPAKREMTDFAKVPKTSARTSTPKTKAPSLSKPAESDIFKSSDYYFNQAIFYQQSRNWEKALTNYAKAERLDPTNPDIYNNIGVIYKELRQYERAIEEFLKAAHLNPDYAKPYNNIGVVYYSKKDFPGAIRNYRKAISIEPENLEALNNLAVAYKHVDQLERAKSVLNQALKINPAHAGTHYNLAVLYEKEGNIDSAIHFYQGFVDLASLSHPTLTVQVKKHIKTLR